MQGLTHAHIESLRRFAAEAQSGKVQTLPGGTVARKEFSWLVVGPPAREPAGGGFSYPVTFPGELAVRELGCTFHFKILNRDDPGKGYNLSKLVGLDPQKLQGDIVLRNWRAGDSFCPIGSRGVRKLKEFFRERKIPEGRRKGWPVLLCAGQIVWVRGFPPAKGVAATDQSRQVLIVEEEPTLATPGHPGNADMKKGPASKPRKRSATVRAAGSSARLKMVVDEKEIRKRVRELARQINRDYAGKTLHVVGILEDGFVFMADLVRALTVPVVCSFVRSQVRDSDSGLVAMREILYIPPVDAAGKDVLLVEGVLQSGITLDHLVPNPAGAATRLVAHGGVDRQSRGAENRRSGGLCGFPAFRPIPGWLWTGISGAISQLTFPRPALQNKAGGWSRAASCVHLKGVRGRAQG